MRLQSSSCRAEAEFWGATTAVLGGFALGDIVLILAAFTDATLLGSYGLVLTNQNLRSKDLGEEPVSTTRAKVEHSEVRINAENKHQIIVAPGQVHDVPSHIGERELSALITLVREWAVGRIN